MTFGIVGHDFKHVQAVNKTKRVKDNLHPLAIGLPVPLLRRPAPVMRPVRPPLNYAPRR